jgi:hypothetical protein
MARADKKIPWKRQVLVKSRARAHLPRKSVASRAKKRRRDNNWENSLQQWRGGGERETTDEARIIAVKPISRKRPLSSPINGKQRDEKRESAVAFIRIDVRDKT